jgi:hypothetical protein
LAKIFKNHNIGPWRDSKPKSSVAEADAMATLPATIDQLWVRPIFRKANPLFPFESRVARWFIFKPKIPIWIEFGGP